MISQKKRSADPATRALVEDLVMEDMIIEFRKIAPYIADNVRAVITDHMSNTQIMAVINAEF